MNIHPSFRSQDGAALLAFMLILITGTSYLLVNKLNANSIKVTGEARTRQALNQAKQALIGYAINYPESHPGDGPGYLVCPDRNNDGMTDTGACALSSSSISSIGRFPYKTLETQDIRDTHGERLWYVVSNNFRNNPKLEPLNSETAGDPSNSLSVNGIPDIAAVIFAPGAPKDDQNRNTGPNDYTNYINAVFNDDKNIITTGNTGNYILLTKDELMQAVEKRVLGEVKIILSTYFSDTNAGNNVAYPWLAPFADPKTSFMRPQGTHTGSNNSTNLTDTSADFTSWNIQNGDVIRNITDGSLGIVTGVTANTLTTGGLLLGTDNDFDQDDKYSVDAGFRSMALDGRATSGSTSLTLVDGDEDGAGADMARDFEALGVSAGNVIHNISDESNGIVESVDSNELTVVSLTGGTDNDFDSGDTYRIRNNSGSATAGSAGFVLEDTSVNFTTMGVRVGDMVRNNTDDSYGRVSSISGPNTLVLEELKFGTDNTFTSGDYYEIARFNTDSNTREGLLAFHEPGKFFPTAFDIDFGVSANSSDVIFDTTDFSGAQSVYQDAVETYITNYVSSSSKSFGLTEGFCIWSVATIAECYGEYEDFVNISGRITSGAGSPSTTFTDSTAVFNTDGVKRGDIAQNYDDESLVISGTADAGSTGTTLLDAGADFSVYEPYSYVIQNITLAADLGEAKIQGVISDIIDANTLVVESYVGEGTEPIEFRSGDTYRIYQPQKSVITTASSDTNLSVSRLSSTSPDFDTGEYYRVIPAAKSSNGMVDSSTSCTASALCTITDADGDFINSGVEVGDIIENTSDSPQSFGEITAVTATTVSVRLYGGTANRFVASNDYVIYHDYVHSRRHEIRARFSGNQNTKSSASKRLRDVCLGYTADCAATSSATALSGSGGIPLVTIRDYEEDGVTEVGRGTFTPSAGSNGFLRVRNIDYYLAEDAGDIPGWFLRNKWHELIYIAYSNGDTPAVATACTPGTNCLIFRQDNDHNPAIVTNPVDNNGVRAIAVIAGKQDITNLDASCSLINPVNEEETVSQDRSTGNLNSYFELENCDPSDDIFERPMPTSVFNDQVRIIN